MIPSISDCEWALNSASWKPLGRAVCVSRSAIRPSPWRISSFAGDILAM